jgi:hypothetical protein
MPIEDHEQTAQEITKQVTQEVIFEEAVVVELISDVTRSMPAIESEFWRRVLAEERSAQVVKRAAVEVAVTLALAKAFESEDDFLGVAQGLAEIDYRACDGRIGGFVRRVIEMDKEAAVDGSLASQGLSKHVLESRFERLLAIADRGAERAAQQ